MPDDPIAAFLDTMKDHLLSTYRSETRPLPHPTDERFIAIIEALWDLKPSARADLPQMIKDAGSCVGQSYPVDLLRAFSIRMATLAVRERSTRRTRVGLIALTLDDFEEEMRESLLVVPLHYRAAELIGADPESLFEEIAAKATSGAAEVLRLFVQRAPEERSIQAMGYEERTTEEGFEFHRTW